VYGTAAVGLRIIKRLGGTFSDVNFADFALSVVRGGSMELLAGAAMASYARPVPIVVDAVQLG